MIQNNRGFTLTEIAVVMVVLGFMAGLAMKMHQVTRTAAVASTVMQVDAIKAAVINFRDVYQGLPGDLPDGDARITSCGAACKNTSPGVSDGKIGSPTWDMTSFQSASVPNAPIATEEGETVVFWRELAAANVGISGINMDGVTGGPASFGGSLPSAHGGGGFMVGYSDGTQAGATQGRPAAAGPYTMTGSVLALAATPQALTSTAGAQALLPSDALQIDRKMDDGLPHSGDVQAYGATASCYGAASPFSYLETVTSKDCGLYFRVGDPPVNGVCGPANGTRVAAVPSTGLCTSGAVTSMTGSQTVTWTCQGKNGAPSANCSATMNAGTVTSVTGTVNIISAGGPSAAAANTPVYPGDTVQTGAASSASIQFSDGSILSLGENTNTSIDQYSYNGGAGNPDKSALNVVQGIFVYMSGLIASNDPGAVTVGTPVGSIGIRGTVFGGNIKPAGQQSIIVIMQGAIALTSGGGTQQISHSLDTLTSTSYSAVPTLGAAIPTEEFKYLFHGLVAVSPGQLGNLLSNPLDFLNRTATPITCAVGYQVVTSADGKQYCQPTTGQTTTPITCSSGQTPVMGNDNVMHCQTNGTTDQTNTTTPNCTGGQIVGPNGSCQCPTGMGLINGTCQTTPGGLPLCIGGQVSDGVCHCTATDFYPVAGICQPYTGGQ